MIQTLTHLHPFTNLVRRFRQFTSCGHRAWDNFEVTFLVFWSSLEASIFFGVYVSKLGLVQLSVFVVKFHGGKKTSEDWNWSLQMELRIFLLIGSIGLLRRRLPQLVPALCALYWAYIVGLAACEGTCELEEVPKQLEDRTRWVTAGKLFSHVSFFPRRVIQNISKN